MICNFFYYACLQYLQTLLILLLGFIKLGPVYLQTSFNHQQQYQAIPGRKKVKSYLKAQKEVLHTKLIFCTFGLIGEGGGGVLTNSKDLNSIILFFLFTDVVSLQWVPLAPASAPSNFQFI